MARQFRHNVEGGWYHITTRGMRRKDDDATFALPMTDAFDYTFRTEVTNVVMCANAYGYDYDPSGRQKSGSRTRPQFGYRQSIKVPW